jgi:Sulfatase
MQKRSRIVSHAFVSVWAIMIAALSPWAVNTQGKKPNFVVIMTDDVGWGDLGSYGGGIMRGAPTPNLDRMAAKVSLYEGQDSGSPVDFTPTPPFPFTGKLHKVTVEPK